MKKNLNSKLLLKIFILTSLFILIIVIVDNLSPKRSTVIKDEFIVKNIIGKNKFFQTYITLNFNKSKIISELGYVKSSNDIYLIHVTSENITERNTQNI